MVDDSESRLNLKYVSAFRAISHPNRRRIIQAIVTHPTGLVSIPELEYTLSMSRSTIHLHMSVLVSNELVEKVEEDSHTGNVNVPYVFYSITDFGCEMMIDQDISSEIDDLQKKYSKIEDSGEIDAALSAPRPNDKIAKAEERQRLLGIK